MKQIKWDFLLLAILAAAGIFGIGVAIAEKSVAGVLGCILAVSIILGYGFNRKRKLRDNGQL